MTVVELAQALLWGLVGALPLGLFGAGVERMTANEESGLGAVQMFLAVIFQIALGVACFKAGIHFK